MTLFTVYEMTLQTNMVHVENEMIISYPQLLMCCCHLTSRLDHAIELQYYIGSFGWIMQFRKSFTHITMTE